MQSNKKKVIKGISRAAENILLDYECKGNVRELEQIIRRAVIMGVGDYVQPDDLRLTEINAAANTIQDNDDSLSLSLVRSYAEKRAIYRAMTEAKGNISKAAKLLDVSRPTLYSLIEKLGIDVDFEH